MRVSLHLPLALAAAVALPASAAVAAPPAPKTPIKHLVVLMQANHSFDNYFGTYPGADGIPKGTCVPVALSGADKRCVKPFHLGDRVIPDLDHPLSIFDRQVNGGKMNGFIAAYRQAGSGVHPSVMGYYDQRELPYMWGMAKRYTLFDRFFTSAKVGTLANHMYWVAGRPGTRIGEGVPKGGFRMPTIFDRLHEKGLSWKFYVENYDPGITYRNPGTGPHRSQPLTVPLLDFDRFLDDPERFSRIADLDEYYDDLRNGTLPAVSYIVSSGSSERPPGDITAGQQFVRGLVDGLIRSSSWKSAAFVWTYDDWGGWYDHVKPPRADGGGYGFRVPALLISPYARRGHVNHTTLDFTSLLKFVQENWALEPLAKRDRAATSIAGAFDFKHAPRQAELLAGPDTKPPAERRGRGVVYLFYGGALVFMGFLLARALSGRKAATW
jgi:phospholipase C